MPLRYFYTRKAFLRCMCFVYMSAFTSLFTQIPGLYGTNGILPVHTQLKLLENTPQQCFAEKPTLVCFASYLGLNPQYMLSTITLLGIIISFMGFVYEAWCKAIPFAVLWILYASLYYVGQVFLQFQWDILLLEAGFLTIFVAPLFSSKEQHPNPKISISLWLIRWLLFRLMFASGVVKLSSGCPTWWDLSALTIHFESQCIPTPLAWYIHHLPKWILKLMTVGTYVIEIGLPLFFFSPLRSLRLFSFWAQVMLQLVIIATGNYNFFNLLTLVLCIPLLDDQAFCFGHKRSTEKAKWKRRLVALGTFLAYFGLVCAVYSLFQIRITFEGGIECDIGFTRAQFDDFLKRAVPSAIYIGMFSLVSCIAETLASSLLDTKGCVGKLWRFVQTFGYGIVAFSLFGVSLIPFSVLDQNTQKNFWPVLHESYESIQKLPVVHSYGLFRRMTGVGGRPEVVIEGSNNLKGPWSEYHFSYKPGNVSVAPPFIVPHQPRLDWQMWFAALDSYNYNPWLVSLTYRLLTGQPEVLALLDKKHIPFPNEPPKYIKASLYHYHYTEPDTESTDWWWREHQVEYLPVFSKEHPPLLDYLTNLGVLDQKDMPVYNVFVKAVIDFMHSLVDNVEASIVVWSVWTAAFALIAVRRR